MQPSLIYGGPFERNHPVSTATSHISLSGKFVRVGNSVGAKLLRLAEESISQEGALSNTRSQGCSPLVKVRGCPRVSVESVGGNPSTVNPPWRNVTPSPEPSVRASQCMAYDPIDGYVLLFGGNHDSSFYNDTWKYSGGVWTNISSSPSPPARALCAMTYDAADGYILLYGGESSFSSYLGDCWKFSGGKWTLVSSSALPGPRTSSTMVFDKADGYVLLFGGYDSGYLGDTWKYLAGTWVLLNLPLSPSPRGSFSMSYDESINSVVLFGGRSSTGTGYLGDTWEFHAGKWSQAMTAQSPSPRAYLTSTYDIADGAVVLFGGCNPCPQPATVFNDSWAFDGNNWANMTSAVSPSARTSDSLSYDPVSGYMVLFGGGISSTSQDDDTWVNYMFPKVGSPVATPNVLDVGQGMSINTTTAQGGKPPYTYNWIESSSKLGCAPVNATNITCKPSGAGAFNVSVTVVDAEGVSTTVNSTSISVNPRIVSIFASPTKSDIDVSQHITLSANVSGGTPPYTFVWFSGNSSLCSGDSTISGRSGSVLNVSPQTSTFYCYSVGDSSTGQPADTNTSNTSLVMVNPALVAAVITPSSPTILPGESLTLQALPSGGSPPYFIQWYQGASPYCTSDSSIFGATSLTITVAPTSNMYYCYTVGDTSQGLPTSLAISATNLVKVTASPTPPTITSFTMTPSPVIVNSKVNVSVVVSGGLSPFSYSYVGLPPGCVSVNSSSFSCTPTLAGTYNVTVMVKDAASKEVNDTETEVVNGLTSALLITLTSSASVVAVGSSYSLTAHLTGGTSPFYYLWSVNGTNVSTGPDTPMWSIHAVATGNYTYMVWVEDSQGIISRSNSLLVSVESTNSPGKGTNHNQTNGIIGPEFFGIPIIFPLIVAVLIAVVVVYFFFRRRNAGSRASPDPVPSSNNWTGGAPPPSGPASPTPPLPPKEVLTPSPSTSENSSEPEPLKLERGTTIQDLHTVGNERGTLEEETPFVSLQPEDVNPQLKNQKPLPKEVLQPLEMSVQSNRGTDIRGSTGLSDPEKKAQILLERAHREREEKGRIARQQASKSK